MAANRNYRIFLMSIVTFSDILYFILVVLSTSIPCTSSHPLFVMSPKLQQASNTLGRNDAGGVGGGPIVLDALADEGHVLHRKRLFGERRKEDQGPSFNHNKSKKLELVNTARGESREMRSREDHDNLILMMNASRRLLENRLDDDGDNDGVVRNSEASQHKLRLKFRRLRVCLVCLF